MVVRVKVRLHSRDRSIEVIALVNAGAETDVPIIAIPPEIAEQLSIWPSESSTAVPVMEFTSETIGYLVQEPVTIELLDEYGNKLSEAETLVLIKPGLEEPAMSDALIERLGIVILRAKSGLWRHISDPETVIRRSM